jgi:hypothetical protein
MDEGTNAYPVTLEIDYPDRELDRLTTLLRPVTIIPIAIVLGLGPLPAVPAIRVTRPGRRRLVTPLHLLRHVRGDESSHSVNDRRSCLTAGKAVRKNTGIPVRTWTGISRQPPVGPKTDLVASVREVGQSSGVVRR